MTHLQKLDHVLKKTNHLRSYSDAWEDFSKDTVLGVNEHDLKIILNKLQRDGYIDFMAGEKYVTGQQVGEGVAIRRNFEGDLFIEAGGFEINAINSKINSEWLKTLQIRQDQMATRMFWINFAIALSTVFSALYYCVDLYWSHQWFRDAQSWWIAVLSLCISLSIGLIVYKILKKKLQPK